MRTFGMIALLGAITCSSRVRIANCLLAAAILAVAILMGIGYWRESMRSTDVSITTAIAALVAFSLGAMAGLGHLAIASSAGGGNHNYSRLSHRIAHFGRAYRARGTYRDDAAAADHSGGAPDSSAIADSARGTQFNPYQIWWMVVLVAGLSYVGYFANKFLGETRGLMVTGLFGGMTSSTAVTLTLAPVARDRKEEREVVAAAILAASAIMFPRLLIVAAALTPDLALKAATLVCGRNRHHPCGGRMACMAIAQRRAGRDDPRPRDSQPPRFLVRAQVRPRAHVI